MKKRSSKKTLIAVIVSLTIAIALLIAGTILRMNDRNIGFSEAIRGFLQDTFRPYR